MTLVCAIGGTVTRPMIKSHRPGMSTVGWPPCVAVNNDARRGVSGRATCGYMRHVGPQRQYFAVLPKHIPPQISGASLPSEYHMYSKSNPACRHAPRTSSFEIVSHVATGQLPADTPWPWMYGFGCYAGCVFPACFQSPIIQWSRSHAAVWKVTRHAKVCQQALSPGKMLTDIIIGGLFP